MGRAPEEVVNELRRASLGFARCARAAAAAAAAPLRVVALAACLMLPLPPLAHSMVRARSRAPTNPCARPRRGRHSRFRGVTRHQGHAARWEARIGGGQDAGTKHINLGVFESEGERVGGRVGLGLWGARPTRLAAWLHPNPETKPAPLLCGGLQRRRRAATTWQP